MRQNFRLNDTDHYTIFDLPIMVTNSIEADDARPPCDALTNDLLTPDEIDAGSANEIGILFSPDSATEVDFEGVTGKGPEENPQGPGGNGNGNDNGNDNGGDDDDDDDGEDGDDEEGVGGEREEAGAEDGLGGAGMLEVSWAFLVIGALLGAGM